MRTIIWDNGHGRETKGKRSPVWDNGLQLFEWAFTRAVVAKGHMLALKEGLKSHILVPEEMDIPIKGRYRRANSLFTMDNSIFVSVHGNAAPKKDPGPHGIETFYYKSGRDLAKYVQYELISELGWKNRGVRKAYKTVQDREGNQKMIYKIAIVKYTSMPAILTENGFYTNPAECMAMLEDETVVRIAIAHIEGIKHYFQNH